ncbi:MAG: hypothetical protein HY270_13725 [Deltaproteobacteria bacterium]|nr:hypothetical protein [Deltaproteobacteria bacterium]
MGLDGWLDMLAAMMPGRLQLSHLILLPALVVWTLASASTSPALAQISDGPVAPSGGSLADLSGPVSAGSRPVHGAGSSVTEGSVGPLSGRSVRGSTSGTITSGSVSDLSVGAVTSRPLAVGGGFQLPADAAMGEPAVSLLPLQQQLEDVQPLSRDQSTEADSSQAGDDDSEVENGDSDDASEPEVGSAAAQPENGQAPESAAAPTNDAAPRGEVNEPTEVTPEDSGPETRH